MHGRFSIIEGMHVWAAPPKVYAHNGIPHFNVIVHFTMGRSVV